MFRLLIADRQEDLLWGLQRYLAFDKSRGVLIRTTTNGEEGLELIKTEIFDLIITELTLDGNADGFDLINRARKVNPNVKIILNSSLDEVSSKRLGRRLAVDFLFQKPFSLRQLSEAIDYLARQPKVWAAKKIEEASFSDLITMLCQSGRTALVKVTDRSNEGVIAIEEGEIRHATFNNLVGEEAVRRLCRLTGGSVQMHSGVTVDKKTVTTGWKKLIAEAKEQPSHSFSKAPHTQHYDESLIQSIFDSTRAIHASSSQIYENAQEFLNRNHAVIAYGLLRNSEIFTVSFSHRNHEARSQKSLVSYLDHMVTLSRSIHRLFGLDNYVDASIELDDSSLVIERILKTSFSQFALLSSRDDLDFVRLLMKQMTASYSLALAGYDQ